VEYAFDPDIKFAVSRHAERCATTLASLAFADRDSILQIQITASAVGSVPFPPGAHGFRREQETAQRHQSPPRLVDGEIEP